MGDITRILNAIQRDDTNAADVLLPIVYNELRRMAANKMAHEAEGHTLQPTALVHEAWLRLFGDQKTQWQNRAHFFGAAAEAMRRILIERARRRRSLKRGAGAQRIDLDQIDTAVDADDETLIVVNDALDKLALEDEQAAEVVKLRFFVGMTNAEAGEALGISERTAKRCWTLARAWLYREIRFQQ